MTTQQTFRLGGVAGYSVRAIGYAPIRKGQSPVYGPKEAAGVLYILKIKAPK